MTKLLGKRFFPIPSRDQFIQSLLLDHEHNNWTTPDMNLVSMWNVFGVWLKILVEAEVDKITQHD